MELFLRESYWNYFKRMNPKVWIQGGLLLSFSNGNMKKRETKEM